MTGYTLPVFACASVLAGLRHLRGDAQLETVTVNLIKPACSVEIPLEQVAKIAANCAIAITRSDSGGHLDITHNTPVWAKVTVNEHTAGDRIVVRGGEGIGRQSNYQNRAAIYSYAHELIESNLIPLLLPQEQIDVTIILPEGKRLAARTSNSAFGVLEGLSLLGTTGIVQPLTAPSQLESLQKQITDKAQIHPELVFCIGENGIDLAQQSGIDTEKIVKTANWLGAMLVAAALAGVESILLFGYHGKLIKLAGGIFHTHNHLADGRIEIMTAYCARVGLSQEQILAIANSDTTESALNLLRKWESGDRPLVDLVYQELAQAIERRSQAYICKYTEKKLVVGSVLFNRRREIICYSPNACLLLAKLC